MKILKAVVMALSNIALAASIIFGIKAAVTGEGSTYAWGTLTLALSANLLLLECDVYEISKRIKSDNESSE